MHSILEMLPLWLTAAFALSGAGKCPGSTTAVDTFEINGTDWTGMGFATAPIYHTSLRSPLPFLARTETDMMGGYSYRWPYTRHRPVVCPYRRPDGTARKGPRCRVWETRARAVRANLTKGRLDIVALV